MFWNGSPGQSVVTGKQERSNNGQSLLAHQAVKRLLAILRHFALNAVHRTVQSILWFGASPNVLEGICQDLLIFQVANRRWTRHGVYRRFVSGGLQEGESACLKFGIGLELRQDRLLSREVTRAFAP